LVLSQSTCVTDRQTDRITTLKTAVAYSCVARQKLVGFMFLTRSKSRVYTKEFCRWAVMVL